MIQATQEFLKQNDELFEKRKKEILESPDTLEFKGRVFYVSSSNGSDANDGMTPETPWQTLQKVSSVALRPDDAILFKRGDLFRGIVRTKPGVTYAAYGTGEKPKFYGWNKDLADPSLWELTDKEHNIWKLKEKILDCGTLVFNHGEAHCRKLIPSYRDLQYVCRDDESRVFDMKVEMTQDLDIFWEFDELLSRTPWKGEDFPVPVVTDTSYGQLYLRCDKGNPGEVFDSVEAVTKRVMFLIGSNPNVKIDNLCMKYIGIHAVAAGGHVVGLHVTNCEIGWIGGTIQNYFGTDPNYPQGRRGSVTRYGNGVEIYGGCDDYLVSNCYIYESYDAGITHQINTTNKVTMTNIRYTDNIIEKCVYGIEYFLDQKDGEKESFMDDIVMSGNIFRLTGYGWGQQRHNVDTPSHIKGWSYVNTASNFEIKDNVFDRSAYRSVHLVALKQESCPKLDGNTFIQHLGGKIGQYGANEIAEPENMVFDEDAENKINGILGDKNAKVYYIK